MQDTPCALTLCTYTIYQHPMAEEGRLLKGQRQQDVMYRTLRDALISHVFENVRHNTFSTCWNEGDVASRGGLCCENLIAK